MSELFDVDDWCPIWVDDCDDCPLFPCEVIQELSADR